MAFSGTGNRPCRQLERTECGERFGSQALSGVIAKALGGEFPYAQTFVQLGLLGNFWAGKARWRAGGYGSFVDHGINTRAIFHGDRCRIAQHDQA